MQGLGGKNTFLVGFSGVEFFGFVNCIWYSSRLSF